MKVYLAAPYAARDYVASCASNLGDLDLGVECCSSWLSESYDINAGTTGAAVSLEDAVVQRHVRQDLLDVETADVLVLLTASSLNVDPATVASGGRHVETGYALALGKPIVVVGEPENIFHRSHMVSRVEDWAKAVGLLGAMAIERRRIGGPHRVNEYGTTDCPVEGVRAYVDEGECSACGEAVPA